MGKLLHLVAETKYLGSGAFREEPYDAPLSLKKAKFKDYPFIQMARLWPWQPVMIFGFSRFQMVFTPKNLLDITMWFPPSHSRPES